MAPVLTTALLEVTVTVSLCIFVYVEFKHAVHAYHFYPAIVPEFLSLNISVKRTLQSSVQLAYDIGSRKHVTWCTCVLPVFNGDVRQLMIMCCLFLYIYRFTIHQFNCFSHSIQ